MEMLACCLVYTEAESKLCNNLSMNPVVTQAAGQLQELHAIS